MEWGLLNNCINYITQSRTGGSVKGFPMPSKPVYETIAINGGTSFKVVRLDVYPPRTIALFKPRLYVKRGNRFEAVRASVRDRIAKISDQ